MTSSNRHCASSVHIPTMDPSSAAIQQTRRTRIVCISDTHNSTPKLPKGDVLIHAGDLTNKGSYSELSKAIQWLEKADFEKKIVIAGNHDLTLDLEFYSAHGHVIHNQDSQDPEKCLSLLKSSRTITYLCHGSATIRLTDPKGPRTEFTVFGSPYSPRVGLWAFSYDREDKSSPGIQISSGPGQEPRLGPGAAELWASIPLDTDIVVSHTPPYGYCDASLGCEELRTRLSQVRPRLHICGHVHHGRGAKRVRWDVSGVSQVNNGLPEPTVENWTDPSPDISSAKISLIDLTARGGNRPLDFYDQAPRERLQREPGKSGPGQQGLSLKPSCARLSSGFEGDDSVWAGPEAELGDYQPITTEAFGSDTQHLGAEPRGRLGRRETCIINCAIVANSWPHTGGKRFNKPIVVDLGLPVWR